MNQIMYKLDGFDDEWLPVGESPVVSYSNLWYGNYTFRVKASNSDGVWNENEVSLIVRILPPFYLTIWAYCVYVLLIIGCSLYAVWYFKQRSNYKHRRQMEKFEQEKEREIYHAKIDFFTNVAHEIRTPLTLITGWYGMNFINMPELHWKYGYVGMILLSIAIVAVEIWFFKKKKIL